MTFTTPDDVLMWSVVLTPKLSSACHTEPLMKITKCTEITGVFGDDFVVLKAQVKY